MNHELLLNTSQARPRDLIVASTQEGLQTSLKARIAQAIEKLLINLKAISADNGEEKPKNVNLQVVLRIPINDLEFETSIINYQLQLSEKQQRYFFDPLLNLSQVVSNHIAGSVTGKCEVEIVLNANQESDVTTSVSETFSVAKEKPLVSTASVEVPNGNNTEMGIVPIGFEGKSTHLMVVLSDIVSVVSKCVDRLKEQGLVSHNRTIICTILSHDSHKPIVTFSAQVKYYRILKGPSFSIQNRRELHQALVQHLEATKSQSTNERSLLIQVSVDNSKS